MKKGLLFLISFFIFGTSVFACGEIKSIKVENAKVVENGSLSYIVKLDNPTKEVFLNVSSDYDFVPSFGSRMVSTNKDALVKVNGYKCGYGIYTYTISFDVSSKVIADNTDLSTNENNKGLKNLEIEGYSIDFSNKVYSYSLDVSNEVTSVNIIATKNREKDIIIVSDKAQNLQIGKNTILITVIDENDNIVYYQVIVNRKKIESNNNYLASLKVTGYDINFERDKTEYSLSLPDYINNLDIVAITEDVNATYQIYGNSLLNNKSKVTITVIAENQEQRDYVINIKKDVNILNLILSYKIYIIIFLLIIILIILIVFTKKKKGRNKDQQPTVMDAPLTTAGEIKENIVPLEPVIETKQSSEPSPLQIITPTDVEEAEYSDNTTEVFKL